MTHMYIKELDITIKPDKTKALDYFTLSGSTNESKPMAPSVQFKQAVPKYAMEWYLHGVKAGIALMMKHNEAIKAHEDRL